MDEDRDLINENLLAPSEEEPSDETPENEEITSEGETSEEDKQVEKEKEQKEFPDWFYKDKFKSLEDQAKAYADAVREMRAKEMEAAELRKKIEEIQKAQQNPQLAPVSSEELIEKIEEEYGMPFQQIKAIYDVQNLILEQKLKPIKETILSSQVEAKLENFIEKTPLAKDYKDEIIQKLSEKPIEERIKTSTIKDVWKEILTDKFPEIVEKVKREARSGKPEAIPSLESNQKKPSTEERKPVLTKEEREYLISRGVNPDEIEKFYQEGNFVKKEFSDILGF